MPEQYERVRDSYVRRGFSYDEAQEKAAKFWNRHYPENPNPWLHEKKKKETDKGWLGSTKRR